MESFNRYTAVINKRYRNGRVDYETWRRRQNKLLEWYNHSLVR